MNIFSAESRTKLLLKVKHIQELGVQPKVGEGDASRECSEVVGPMHAHQQSDDKQ